MRRRPGQNKSHKTINKAEEEDGKGQRLSLRQRVRQSLKVKLRKRQRLRKVLRDVGRD